MTISQVQLNNTFNEFRQTFNSAANTVNSLTAGSGALNANTVTATNAIVGASISSNTTINAVGDLTVANASVENLDTSGDVNVNSGNATIAAANGSFISPTGNVELNTTDSRIDAFDIHAENRLDAGADLAGWATAVDEDISIHRVISVDDVDGPSDHAVINRSNGVDAYAEFIAMNDVGNSSQGWLSTGINSSDYAAAEYGVTKADDGYLLYQAPEGTTASGDLVIGTGGNGQGNKILFSANGFDDPANNTQMIIHPGQKVEISIGTESQNTETGALVVRGGLGLTGNLNVGGNTTISGAITLLGAGNTVTTDSLAVENPIIFVGANNNSDTLDLGVVGEYVAFGGTKYTGVVRDANASGKYTFFANTSNDPANTVDFTDVNLTYPQVKMGSIETVSGTSTFGGPVTMSPADSAIAISPSGSGTVAIQPGSQLTLGTAGQTTSIVGNIQAQGSSQTVTFNPGASGAFTVNPGAVGNINNTRIGTSTPVEGRFTSLTANSTGTVTLSPTGTVTIAPTSTTTVGTAGQTTTLSGNLSATGSNQTVVLSPTGTGSVTVSPVGGITANPSGTSNVQNITLFGTAAPGAGRFTNLTANSTGTVTLSPTGTVTIAPTSTTTVGTSGQTLQLNGNPSFASGVIIGAGTATRAPLVLTTGTNLTTPAAGAVEYSGNILTVTNNTSLGRLPVLTGLYVSGAGTAGITGGALFPAAVDTITLPIGTYMYTINMRVTVATSTVSATLNWDPQGAGSAVGTYSYHGVGSITAGGATSIFDTPTAVSLATTTAVTAASAVAGRVYVISGSGIINVTTSGTIIPAYGFSASLTSGTITLAATNRMTIQQIASSSVTSVGAWA